MSTDLDEYINLMERYSGRVKSNCILYFDETNNIRKAKLTKEGTNEDLGFTYFVLGGIALKNSNYDLNCIKNIFPQDQLPPEFKYKYMSCKKTNFIEAISKDRFLKYFDFLSQNNIYIHFYIFHFVYYSLIDILDSLFEEEDCNSAVYARYHVKIKSEFTEVLYEDYDLLLNLLYKYQFPEIKTELVNDFINDIYKLYLYNFSFYFDEQNIDSFYKEMLRQMIKAKRSKKNLLLLTDNKPLVIHDDFVSLYLHSMVSLREDSKIFDEERNIMKELKKKDCDFKAKLNIEFNDSKNEIGIQLADVICGFVSKLLTLISEHSDAELREYVSSLDKNSNSILTLKSFFVIYNNSSDYCERFVCKTLPLYIELKFNRFQKLVLEK